MPKSFCICCTLFLLFSCQSLKIKVDKGTYLSASPSGQYYGGVGRTDLTPPPGHSMGGYGQELGKIAKGWWTRLYATANYIEDPTGNFIVIVATDLWSISNAMGDKIINLLHKETDPKFKISRESIILTATHTHNGPGNIASSYGYNFGSAALMGFDEKLFDFVCIQIKEAIKIAIDNKEAATVSYNQIKIPGISRNRSIEAFQANPISIKGPIISRVSNPASFLNECTKCLTRTDEVFQAVDPFLTTLTIKRLSDNEPISITAMYGMHPTAMGAKNELISSDVFGVARTLSQNALRLRNPNLHISFINGLGGDISSNWYNQDLQNTNRIGTKLAEGILSSFEGINAKSISGNIVRKLSYFNVTDVSVSDPLNELSCIDDQYHRTSPYPAIGKGSKMGAEDGRTNGNSLADECEFDESLTQACEGVHASKNILGISHHAQNAVPRTLPIGLYELGDLQFITMPGEVTVALGERLKTIQNPRKTSVVLSMANEYVSYLTTPSEYMLQHYEGAFTLFGAATGLYLIERVEDLKRGSKIENTYGSSKKKKYCVGTNLSLEKSFNSLIAEERTPKQFTSMSYGLHNQNLRHSKCKTTKVYSKVAFKSKNYSTPRISIEKSSEEGPITHKILINGNLIDQAQTDEESTNFITYVNKNQEGNLTWESIWLIPEGFTSNDNLEMKLRFADNSVLKCPISQSLTRL